MVIGVEELAAPLRILPEVEFCCAYGSSLRPNNTDKMAMVDYILGVSDPFKWHSENLERNRGHYASWMACLGPNAIAHVADVVGVGVHFNPFVPWKDKMIKYGVVRMQDLAYDVLTWNRFYLSGRLQKPVFILVDNFDIRKVNKINLKAAVAAALLLSPTEFAEEDLYSTICSLSYMGDLRMLFAEDKHKVKKIVKGSFSSFQAMYRPFVMEYSVEGLLEHSFHDNQLSFKQVVELFRLSKNLKCDQERIVDFLQHAPSFIRFPLLFRMKPDHGQEKLLARRRPNLPLLRRRRLQDTQENL